MFSGGLRLDSPSFFLFLMVSAYWLAVYIRARSKISLINPQVITVVIVIGYLQALDVPFEKYEPAGNLLSYWLQPAVVCLALPLYRQWRRIGSQLGPVLISQLVGSLVGIVSGVYLALLFGASPAVSAALATKSVTMPIAIEVTQAYGGIVPVAALAVIIAGLTGQLGGLWLMRRVVRRPMSLAVAEGTASHAMGIARCLEISQKYASYATVGLIFNGILTSFIAPYLVPLLLPLA